MFSTVTHSDLQLEVRSLYQHICPDCHLFPWVPQELISATSVWIMWQFWTLTSEAPGTGGNKICWETKNFHLCGREKIFLCMHGRVFWLMYRSKHSLQMWEWCCQRCALQNSLISSSQASTSNPVNVHLELQWPTLSIHCTSFNHDPITKLSSHALKSSPLLGCHVLLLRTFRITPFLN
jgi:hypothetical protein